jgi:citrate synthase
MDNLKKQFKDIVIPKTKEIKDFIKQYDQVAVENVTVGQLYGGMRDVISLITETSLLDSHKGIEFHNLSINSLYNHLPKTTINSKEPTPEMMFYLLLIGKIPTSENITDINNSWKKRAKVPSYVYDVISKLPKSNPMGQFITAISAMNSESVFNKAYLDGVHKEEYWEYIYEDAMNLIACLPSIAAYIYSYNYGNGKIKDIDPTLDWAGNLAQMLGDKDSSPTSLMKEFMRLYTSIHSDHEGGNASAFTGHVAGSTLASPYAAFSAGMCSLSGPLHGMATQTSLDWIINLVNKHYGRAPNKQEIQEYIADSIANGQVIPGYGHAVLRKTDPRFTAQMDFAKKHNLKSPYIEAVWGVYDVAPEILGSIGKIKNPFPNVDSHSGSLLNYFGFNHTEYYTVLFGVSRALGILSQLIWSRALMTPIFRPKSVTFDLLKNIVKNK